GARIRQAARGSRLVTVGRPRAPRRTDRPPGRQGAGDGRRKRRKGSRSEREVIDSPEGSTPLSAVMVLLQRRVCVPALWSVLRHGGDASGHQAQEAGDEKADDVLRREPAHGRHPNSAVSEKPTRRTPSEIDRKSTRLNSSHRTI